MKQPLIAAMAKFAVILLFKAPAVPRTAAATAGFLQGGSLHAARDDMAVDMEDLEMAADEGTNNGMGINPLLQQQALPLQEMPPIQALTQPEAEVLNPQQGMLNGFLSQPNALVAQQAAVEHRLGTRLHHEMAVLLAAQENKISTLKDQLEAKQKQLVLQMDNLHVGFLEGVFHALNLPRVLWLHQFLCIGVYLVFVVVAGWIYGLVIMDQDYASLRRRPLVSRDRFSFHLFDGFQCDPDWRICICSLLFTPIRWADTASSIKIRFLHFWPALIIFAVLLSFGFLSIGITAFLLLLIVVQQRQRIRQVYGLPYGTFATRFEDCLTWTFCGPCATMQEALEVEFIDPPFVH